MLPEPITIAAAGTNHSGPNQPFPSNVRSLCFLGRNTEGLQTRCVSSGPNAWRGAAL